MPGDDIYSSMCLYVNYRLVLNINNSQFVFNGLLKGLSLKLLVLFLLHMLFTVRT
jgi:hypothetical protein